MNVLRNTTNLSGIVQKVRDAQFTFASTTGVDGIQVHTVTDLIICCIKHIYFQ